MIKKSDGERIRIDHIISRFKATISGLEIALKDKEYPPGRDISLSFVQTTNELVTALSRLEIMQELEDEQTQNQTALVEETKEYKQLTEKLESSQEWYSARWEKLRDLLRDTEYWTRANSIMANGVNDIHDPPTYQQQMNLLKFKLEKTIEERDKAQKNYQWMVDNAVATKLDGYRELGAKCAKLEEERDRAIYAAKQTIKNMEEMERNLYLKINDLEKQVEDLKDKLEVA